VSLWEAVLLINPINAVFSSIRRDLMEWGQVFTEEEVRMCNFNMRSPALKMRLLLISISYYCILMLYVCALFQVNAALEDAPIYNEKEGPMIDYVEFCKILSGRA
jgi:hypothetical protein